MRKKQKKYLKKFKNLLNLRMQMLIFELWLKMFGWLLIKMPTYLKVYLEYDHNAVLDLELESSPIL
jgi:hypothetical protein